MKKILPSLVVGVLVLSGIGAGAISFDEIKTVFQWEPKEINNISLNDDELDQYQTEMNYAWVVGPYPWLGPWGPPNINHSVAQSFIPTKNILTRIQILIGRNRTATYPYVLAIREELTGEDIAIAKVNAQDIANESFNWSEFDFADVLVTTGQTYYMISYTTNITDNWYAWAANSSNPYPNGTMAVSVDDGESWDVNDTLDMCFMTYGRDNSPPNAPSITGETNGKAGTEYEYTFNATDPDGDDVKYFIDWGDNNTEWTGYNPSGTEVKVKHTWGEKGDYTITSKAKDIYDAEGPEGTLEVTMPKNKAFNFNFPLLNWLFERFPNAFPILRYTLGL